MAVSRDSFSLPTFTFNVGFKFLINNITNKLTNDIYDRSSYSNYWRYTNHLTLKMTSALVVETSVNVISNRPSQDYTHPDDRTWVQTIYNFTKVRPSIRMMYVVTYETSSFQNTIYVLQCEVYFLLSLLSVLQDYLWRTAREEVLIELQMQD